MKRLFLLILCFVMLGCAHTPMQFKLAPGTTQDDYAKARIECGDSDQGSGYFLFGPLIILAPAVAIIEGAKYSKRGGLQDCLEARGFKCIANCAKESTVNP